MKMSQLAMFVSARRESMPSLCRPEGGEMKKQERKKGERERKAGEDGTEQV